MSKRRISSAQKTKRIALSAVICALGVVMIGLGAIIEVLDITSSMLASLCLLPVLLCYGNKYALMTYAVTAVLSVILMPHSFASWMYVGLVGYYPLLKRLLDRFPKIISYIFKTLLVLLALIFYFFVFYLIFMNASGSLSDAFIGAFSDKDSGMVMGILTVALSWIAFLAYDLLIDRVLILYHYKWRSRFEKWMK